MSQARRRATSVRLFAGLGQEASLLLSEGHPWAEGHLWVEGRLTAGTGLSRMACARGQLPAELRGGACGPGRLP